MRNNKIQRKIDWISFFAGALIASWALILIYTFALRPSGTSVSTSTSDSESTESTEESYNLDIKDWEVSLESGETITLHTPSDFYSLSDQYISNLSDYYGVDDLDTDIVVVGDNVNTFSCNTIINADALSDVSGMLKQIYGDSYDESDVVTSEAYTYMTTGELPEDLPLNYTCEEIATYTVDGIDFVAYEVNYDTEYVNEESTESVESTEEAEPSTTTVHTQQIACYSKTDDSLEIIIYQNEFDKEAALEALEEFIGA